MRQLVLDTETTGLDPRQGHRVIELAVVELVDRRPTGRYLHFHFNPERDIDAAATEVHGMTLDDLRDKPRFADLAGEFLDFADGAEWIIHNASFDLAFLDYELGLCGRPACATLHARVTDTLSLAREQYPGKRNNLDALCERFGVDRSQRTLHTALVDARLLAEVYLAMTRGQESLTIDIAPVAETAARQVQAGEPRPRLALLVIEPSAEELVAHLACLEAIQRESKGRCLWLAVEARAAA